VDQFRLDERGEWDAGAAGVGQLPQFARFSNFHLEQVYVQVLSWAIEDQSKSAVVLGKRSSKNDTGSVCELVLSFTVEVANMELRRTIHVRQPNDPAAFGRSMDRFDFVR
jgi:hypothetical protein